MTLTIHSFRGVTPRERIKVISPGGTRRGISLQTPRGIWLERRMLKSVSAAIVVAMIVASHASAETCLRPKWTECIAFPNGGRHTGVSPYGMPVAMEVPTGADICVSNEWEIRAETYAQFSRNGLPWPNRDWEVDVDTFCFYKN